MLYLAIGCQESSIRLFFALARWGAAAALDDFLVHGGGKLVPFPSVFEGFELGGGSGAVLFGEEDVAVLIAFERRVEIDEVDGFVLDVAAENVEIVAVIKLVHGYRANHTKSSGEWLVASGELETGTLRPSTVLRVNPFATLRTSG